MAKHEWTEVEGARLLAWASDSEVVPWVSESEADGVVVVRRRTITVTKCRNKQDELRLMARGIALWQEVYGG